jgi:hypothetical protein
MHGEVVVEQLAYLNAIRLDRNEAISNVSHTALIGPSSRSTYVCSLEDMVKC